MRGVTILATLFWAGSLPAQSTTRQLDFPTYPLGAGVVALGGAGTAGAHDAAGSLNPATLLVAPRLSIYHYEGFADYAGNHLAGSVTLWGRIAVGASVRRLGWDKVIEDDLGIPTDGLRTGDALYSGTVAVSPIRAVQVGAAVGRLVSDNLGVRISATSWSFGTLVTYAEHGRVGVAVLHAGAPARGVGDERYALPTVVRTGLSHDIGRAFTVVFDAGLPTHATDAWSAHAGVEWRAPAFVVLRAGLESTRASDAVERDTRIASGLGLVFRPFAISLSTRFGGIAGSQELYVGLDVLRPGRHEVRRSSVAARSRNGAGANAGRGHHT
jgi:hypothetical protein